MAQHDLPFDNHHAFIIGINAYPNPRHRLISARPDAEALADFLRNEPLHQFQVHEPLVDEDATKENIERLIDETIPSILGPNDRVLFYFAGHGIAIDNHDPDNNDPKGFLVPVDGTLDDNDSMVSMDFLRERLEDPDKWGGRHGLLIMDCCFAGAFQWSSATRNFGVSRATTKKVYDRRFTRYTTDPAWQVVTSASSDEEANDVVSRLLGARGGGNRSPFAQALLEGLSGAADFGVLQGEKDGVITATELFVYIRDRVLQLTENSRVKQTPDLLELGRHAKGEYMFINPDPSVPFNLPEFPKGRNPYQGLQTFEEEHAEFFYGREQVVQELMDLVEEQPLVVITAGSGMGKSSLVKAGLIPVIRRNLQLELEGEEEAEAWNIVSVRPDQNLLNDIWLPQGGTLSELEPTPESIEPSRLQKLRDEKTILIIDQYELALVHGVNDERYLGFDRALAGLIKAEEDRVEAGEDSRFRLILTIRSDYELLLLGAEHELSDRWITSRYVVPALSWENLYDIVTLPAEQLILFFEPEDFPAKLVNEVSRQPGALPLLSLTLNSLFDKLEKRIEEEADSSRTMLESDFDAMGGLIGVVSARADAVYKDLGEEEGEPATPEQRMMKRIILRMLKIENGKLVRRKVPYLLQETEAKGANSEAGSDSTDKEEIPKIFNELDFEDDADDALLKSVLKKLEEEQLVIAPTPDEETGQLYLEPMHDALINFWPRCLRWVQDFGPSNIVLQRLLWSAVKDYLSREEMKPEDVFTPELVRASLLWDRNPKLEELKVILESEDNWLNKAEVDFVRESIQKRENLVTKLLRERDEARSSALAAKGLLYFDGNNTIGYNLAAEAYDKSKSEDALNAIRETGSRRSRFYKRYAGHSEAITSVAYLSDGQRFVTASNDGTARLWLKAGEEAHRFEGHRLKILSLSVSPDDKWLVTASHDRSIRIWSLEDFEAEPVVLEAHQGPVTSVCFSPVAISLGEGDEPSFKFISGSTENRVILWDVDGSKLREYTRDDVHQVWSVAFSPDGQEILAGTGNKLILLWNLQGDVIREFVQDGHHAIVSAVAMHGSKEFVLSGGSAAPNGEENQMLLWENRDDSAKVYQVLDRCEGAITSVTFLEQRDQMAMTCQDGSVYIGNVIDYDPQRLGARGQAMNAVDFHPEARNLLVGDGKGDYLIYDLHGAIEQRCSEVGAGISPVLFVPSSFAPDHLDLESEALFVGGTEGQGFFLNPGNKRRFLVVQHEQNIRSAAFSRNGQFLVTGGMDGKVKRTNFQGVDNWELTLEGLVESVAISGDGQQIYIANGSQKILVWSNGSDSPKEHAITGRALALALSTDDKFLLIGCSSGKLLYWNTQTDQEIELKGLNDDIFSVAISPDGNRLMAGARDGRVITWNNEGKKVQEIRYRNQVNIRCVRFSSDGRFFLVTGAGFSNRGIANIYDIEGNLLQELEDEVNNVWTGDFSTDSLFIATKDLDDMNDTDGKVRLWRNYYELRQVGWMERLNMDEELQFGVQEPALMAAP